MNMKPSESSKITSDCQMKFDVQGQTDVGLVREKNEDQFLIFELEKHTNVLASSFAMDETQDILERSKGLVMIVADGVGGQVAGERASQLATETIYGHLRKHMPWFMRLHHEHENELVNALKVAVQECELAVKSETEMIPSEAGMGTTLTLAYLLWPSLYVVHVGDSRCYIKRNSEMLQITRDHTYAQALLEAGELKEHEAKTSRFSHVLLNSIGRGTSELHPEVYTAELEKGDTILLCTDGIYGMLEDDRIGELVESKSASQACKDLVDHGNEAGGRDNLTVIVCKPCVE